MDVRSLQFEEGSFDSVIDKGTLDSILVIYIYIYIYIYIVWG